jgi:hypothetical protein
MGLLDRNPRNWVGEHWYLAPSVQYNRINYSRASDWITLRGFSGVGLGDERQFLVTCSKYGHGWLDIFLEVFHALCWDAKHRSCNRDSGILP